MDWCYFQGNKEIHGSSVQFSCSVMSSSLRPHESQHTSWRRLLRVPWTVRRSNQSILKEISPGCSLEGRMLKLKLQYFGHLMRRANSSEKTLIMGKTEDKRRRRWQRMRWLDSITDSMDMNLSKLRETVEDRGAWRAVIHKILKSQTQLSNWTATTILAPSFKPQEQAMKWTQSRIRKCFLSCPVQYYLLAEVGILSV